MNIELKAKEFAIKAHKGQVRKSDKEKPMIIHPINVGQILKQYGFDENVVSAGYLHDVVEDTSYELTENRHKITFVNDLDPNKIYKDLFKKLTEQNNII